VHTTHVFGLASVSQAGSPDTLPQSASVAQGAQLLPTQAAAVAEVQSLRLRHSMQVAATQKGAALKQVAQALPPMPQELDIVPGKQSVPVRQPVQQLPPPHMPDVPASVQERVLAPCAHTPVPAVQESSVHTLPSSQLFAVPAQAPPEHTSLTEHASPSSQLAVLFTYPQAPLLVSQLSLVQALPSSQFLAEPLTQDPPAQRSLRVQPLPSSQLLVLGVCVQLPPPQASFVQGFASSQSAVRRHSTQLPP